MTFSSFKRHCLAGLFLVLFFYFLALDWCNQLTRTPDKTWLFAFIELFTKDSVLFEKRSLFPPFIANKDLTFFQNK